MRDKAETCPGCGTRAEEWEADEDAHVSDHYTCPGCARLQEHSRNNLDRGPDGQPLPGQHTFLTTPERFARKMAERRQSRQLPALSDD